MPDIAMCSNHSCKNRKTCYRFMAKPDPYWQSYFKFEVPPKNAKQCGHYWKLGTAGTAEEEEYRTEDVKICGTSMSPGKREDEDGNVILTVSQLELLSAIGKKTLGYGIPGIPAGSDDPGKTTSRAYDAGYAQGVKDAMNGTPYDVKKDEPMKTKDWKFEGGVWKKLGGENERGKGKKDIR